MLDVISKSLPLFKNPWTDLGEGMEVLATFLKSSPYVEIEQVAGRYSIKTANRLDEFHKIFKFRHDIFVGECHASTPYESIDLDEFDAICDHIIIQETHTGEIVGYYRVLSSAFTNQYYSENEFDLDSFKKLSGNKLELGRACIHPEHRNGQVLSLLWKGIGQYCLDTETRYLFGCSSVHSKSTQLAHQIYHYFAEKGVLSKELRATPIGDFKMNVHFERHPHIYDREFAMKSVPALLKSYISAGAVIAGAPALDREFSCLDFMTILDLERLSPGFKRRYF